MKMSEVRDWDDLMVVTRESSPFFFAPHTMKSFGSRLIGFPEYKQTGIESPSEVVVFITSEKGWGEGRVYSLRCFNGERIIDLARSWSPAFAKRVIQLHYQRMMVEVEKAMAEGKVWK